MTRDAIDIIPYQKTWQEQFNLAKEDLQYALGDISACIEHIGSTSIQNMPSKDRIDIQIGVKDISDESCELINTKLIEFGFPTAYLSADHLPQMKQMNKNGERFIYKVVRIDGVLKLIFISEWWELRILTTHYYSEIT